VRATVCSPTGLLPGPDCPSVSEEWFVRGTEPREVESYFVRQGGTLAVNPPPEARAWAIDAGLTIATDATPPASTGLRIVQPPPGAIFVAAPELESSRVLLRATAPGAIAIEFVVNGVLAGRGDSADVSLAWAVEPGGHEVNVRALYADGGTETVTSTFEVREP
jgi:hypothetical protein